MDAVATKAERRWPMAVAVIAAVGLQAGTPHRGQLPYWWIFPALELLLLVVMIARDPGRIDSETPASRRVTVALIAVLTIGTMGAVGRLVYDILTNVQIDGESLNATDLLGRGAAIWFTNIIVFSLWFWEFDRGGPVARAHARDVPPSFAFPENATPELVPPGWLPTYPDYLYLAFTNATAFSPTDTLPVRLWAKMVMMLESMASLAIAVCVIARAINILQ